MRNTVRCSTPSAERSTASAERSTASAERSTASAERSTPQQNAVPPQQAFVPAYDPYDHTAEFDPKDISDNKVFAMLCYLMDFIGIIVALLATHSSKYTMFHIRQALKITVVSILSVFVLIIPFLGWIAFPILQGIIWVIKIISFFQICSGKAKEPAIIRSFGFLR
ncbi:MAG: zinc ribbon domain-containing protein [[Eubacterium] siraeum]